MDAATERKTYKISIPELKKIFINSKLKPPPTNAMRDFLGEMNKGVDLNEFLKPETLIPKSKLSPKYLFFLKFYLQTDLEDDNLYHQQMKNLANNLMIDLCM